MNKKTAIATLVVVVGLLGWRIVVKIRDQAAGNHGRRGKGGAVAVEIASVGKATVREIGRFTGSLVPRSRYVVAPKIPGRLEKITVDVGDAIKSGRLIAQLDDDEYAQQVEQARAELAVAQATVAESKSALEVAKRELDRVTALREKKVASESELDETDARHAACVAKHKVSLAEVTRREAALKAAEVRLSYTRILASWEDTANVRVVGERFVDEGEMLQANTPIVSILDNRVMTALIDVIERDYSKIALGQPAVLATDAFTGREFVGKITRIAPLLKEMSRQARVEIEIPNDESLLKPGMFVRALIEFDEHEDTTVILVSALARRDGRQGVFAADTAAMTARFVPVTVGYTEGELVEILEPALSGSVVTLGHHLLEDGAAIRVTEEERTGAGPYNGKGPEDGRRQQP